MPLTTIQSVRSLIGDMDKSSVQEFIQNGDGVTTNFQVDMFPMRTGTFLFYNTGTLTSASANYSQGTFQTTNSAPAAGNQLIATYQYNALSDDEIQACIDIASAAGTLLAASYGARAIAANYARFFSYTQGNKSVNKDKLSEKLLNLAESLEDAYEKNISFAGIDMSLASYDNSGTFFEGYDTAIANVQVETS